MKRMTLFLLGTGVGVLSLALILPDNSPLAGKVLARTEETITLDVAMDSRKFNYMRGLALSEIVRGDGFINEGKIFPAGALLAGNQNNDPNAPGTIGTLVICGTSTDTLAGHLANPMMPATFAHQYLLLSNGMLTASGWRSPAGGNDTAVTGGTRAFSGASGDLTITRLGTNATGAANLRYTIVLKKQAPK